MQYRSTNVILSPRRTERWRTLKIIKTLHKKSHFILFEIREVALILGAMIYNLCFIIIKY